MSDEDSIEKLKAELEWHKSYYRPQDDPNNPRLIKTLERELADAKTTIKGLNYAVDRLDNLVEGLEYELRGRR